MCPETQHDTTIGGITINEYFCTSQCRPHEISEVQRVLAGISLQTENLKEFFGFQSSMCNVYVIFGKKHS